MINLFFERLFPALEQGNIDTIAIVSHKPTFEKMLSVQMLCLETWVIQKETWKEIEEALIDTDNIRQHINYINLLKE